MYGLAVSRARFAHGVIGATLAGGVQVEVGIDEISLAAVTMLAAVSALTVSGPQNDDQNEDERHQGGQTKIAGHTFA